MKASMRTDLFPHPSSPKVFPVLNDDQCDGHPSRLHLSPCRLIKPVNQSNAGDGDGDGDGDGREPATVQTHCVDVWVSGDDAMYRWGVEIVVKDDT